MKQTRTRGEQICPSLHAWIKRRKPKGPHPIVLCPAPCSIDKDIDTKDTIEDPIGRYRRKKSFERIPPTFAGIAESSTASTASTRLVVSISDSVPYFRSCFEP